MVADALSQKSHRFGTKQTLARIDVVSSQMEGLKVCQEEALQETNFKVEVMVKQRELLTDDSRGIMLFQGRIWVPKLGGNREVLLDESHKSRCSIHYGSTKMYLDLKLNYWWTVIKLDMAKYVEECVTSLRVKAKHQNLYGSFQPLMIPEWKWDNVTIDFVTKLLNTLQGHDTIWVIVDRLTKSAHFLEIRGTFPFEKLARLYINNIVSRHGVLLSIVFDRDIGFTSNSWASFQRQLGMKVKLNMAYHPQTGCQSEETIQTLVDMLREFVIDFGGSWDTHLTLIDFSNNNSYHSILKVEPFEVLYSRKCRTLVCWLEAREKKFVGPEIVKKTIDKVREIRERLKAAQDRQNS